MDMMLIETIQDTDKLIQYLDGKIVKYRNNPKFAEVISLIHEFYKDVVIPWNGLSIETDVDVSLIETQVKNEVLDFINKLNKIFDS